MKKLLGVAIALILVVVNFSVVLAAPWDNPNGFIIPEVDCGDHGTFDIWVPNFSTTASFNHLGKIGISKALYIDFGNGYDAVWRVPGNGVYKNTTWCEWELDGMQMAGDILIP